MVILSAAQRQQWTIHGWLLFSQSLAPEVIPALSGWVEEMAVKGIKRTQRLLYYERTAQGKSLNGCLEFALGHQAGLIPPNEVGCIDPQVARTLTWTPVPVPAGDVLFFSSKAPHRSGANRTDTPRRAIYLT
jgi:ectoine hydroxylase-related dioxygenase (phytanoyl-CoA dioxygenase family)